MSEWTSVAVSTDFLVAGLAVDVMFDVVAMRTETGEAGKEDRRRRELVGEREEPGWSELWREKVSQSLLRNVWRTKRGEVRGKRESWYCLCCIIAHCTLYAAITITELSSARVCSSQQAGKCGSGEVCEPDVEESERESDEVEYGGAQSVDNKAAERVKSD